MWAAPVVVAIAVGDVVRASSCMCVGGSVECMGSWQGPEGVASQQEVLSRS